MNETFITKLTWAKRERKFLPFFILLSGFSFEMSKKPSTWMRHLSPNWTARSAKENFWLFFHTFKMVFLLKCSKTLHLNEPFISKLTRAKCERKFLNVFFILLSWFSFEMLKHPSFEWDIYLQINLHEAGKKILTFFSYF